MSRCNNRIIRITAEERMVVLRFSLLSANLNAIIRR